ncbi:MAG TPA: ABC transporter permease [Vicinamibacterales bacterium]|nr:ABC transporter permease [Vicinamibacterales bacterium]
MRRFIARLINVFRPERPEEDLEREIAAHLALLEDEYRRRGMSEDEARFAARRALGGARRTQDLHRDARSFVWLDDLRRDLAHAARSLKRTPGFTLVAVLTLALGIGATTAIFTVISAVLLRPLPYVDADRLVQVFAPPSSNPIVSRRLREPSLYPRDFDMLRRQSYTLSHVAGYILTTATLTGRGDAVRLTGVQASASLFPALGVAPLIGRSFSEAEANGSDAVVVLSHSAWQRYFNGDRVIVGRVIALDGRGHTVAGVMPERFAFPDPTVQFWTPYISPSPKAGSFISPAVFARLQNGVSRAAAEAEINTVLQPEASSGGRYQLAGMQEELVAPVKTALLILSGAVGLVLLIACVNVANLLLACTAARQVEIALRRAIGASPGRLIRQLLTESSLLALLGAVAGTVLAIGGVELLRVLAASLPRRDLGPGVSLPRLDEITVDARVLIFIIALTLLTGVICGLVPALRHSRPREADVLRERGASPRVRGVLVVAEIAMAMVLFVAGGLLMHSFYKLATTDRGYDPARVMTFQATARPTPRTQARAFVDQLLDRIAALPGVTAVGYSNNLPLVQQGFGRDVYPQPPSRDQRPRPQPGLHAISPGFTTAMGLRIVDGRSFSVGEAARHETLVTRAFARSAFFDGRALGSHIYSGKDEWEVVGILEDINQFSLQQRPNPEMFIVDFIPAPPGLGGNYFAVRTSSDPSALAGAVRRIAGQLDASATVDNVATMDQIVSNAMSRPRLYAVLLGLFAAVAVALAAIGIYGVLAFHVAHRTREIGIRVALGARRGQVMTLILHQAAVLAAIGIVAGVIGAAALSRSLEGLLFGLTPLDPATFVAVIGAFAAVAALASYVPARRATRIEPQVALRAE